MRLDNAACRCLEQAVVLGDTASAVFHIFSINFDLCRALGRGEDDHAELLTEIGRLIAAGPAELRCFALVALGPVLRDARYRNAVRAAGLQWSEGEERWLSMPEEATVRQMKVTPLQSDGAPFIHLVVWAEPSHELTRYLRAALSCDPPPPPLIRAAIRGWFMRHFQLDLQAETAPVVSVAG